MAFTLNHVSLDSAHGLATLTLHETQGKQNRVVHVIVPNASRARLSKAKLTSDAKAAAKKALRDAASAL